MCDMDERLNERLQELAAKVAEAEAAAADVKMQNQVLLAVKAMRDRGRVENVTSLDEWTIRSKPMMDGISDDWQDQLKQATSLASILELPDGTSDEKVLASLKIAGLDDAWQKVVHTRVAILDAMEKLGAARARFVGELLQCIVVVMSEDDAERARKMDAKFKQAMKPTEIDLNNTSLLGDET